MRPSTPTAMDESDTPRFTVQQIMLLQKLKQSGLTRDQILKGLEEIDKMDDIPVSLPLATFPSKPMRSPPPLALAKRPFPILVNANGTNGVQNKNAREESAPSDQKTPSASPTSPHTLSLSPAANVPLNRSPKIVTSHPLHPMHQATPLMFGSHLQNHNQMALLHPSGNWNAGTSRAMAAATAVSLLQNGFPHHNLQHHTYPTLMNGRTNPGLTNVFGMSNGNAVVEIDGEKVDITEELDDLFRRDQAQVKEDIRKFINERHISQSAIAKATGNAISQSYISQWLAQPQDISGQKKKAMYTWYLIEKRKPPGVMTMNSGAPIIFRNEMEQDYAPPICLKTKRGARFTWPKECLTILENYYNSNPYPDESKREEIAAACNSIIQTHKAGMMITDLDKVTTVKVYNWFANRRKDDKRRKHIEHIEALDHHQQYMTNPAHRSNTVSPSSSNHSSESPRVHEVTDHQAMAEKVQSDILAMRKKEEQMALALQMAAVNHSILALVNQHREIVNVNRDDDSNTPLGGRESERDENEDNESVGGGSSHGNIENHAQDHQRHESEGDVSENNSTSSAMEIHRENSNTAMTQSPIQART
ncbi:homeobox-containing protein 1-like [Styela clava]